MKALELWLVVCVWAGAGECRSATARRRPGRTSAPKSEPFELLLALEIADTCNELHPNHVHAEEAVASSSSRWSLLEGLAISDVVGCLSFFRK